jgi:hypothetical protein
MTDPQSVVWLVDRQTRQTASGPRGSKTSNVVCLDAFRQTRLSPFQSNIRTCPKQPQWPMVDREQFIFEAIVRRELSGDVEF